MHCTLCTHDAIRVLCAIRTKRDFYETVNDDKTFEIQNSKVSRYILIEQRITSLYNGFIHIANYVGGIGSLNINVAAIRLLRP